MNLTFRDRRIAGVLTVVPRREVRFDDEVSRYTFPVARSMRLKEVMGYDRHRVVEDGVCASDLCVVALEHLFATQPVAREDIDALVLVTQSPDHLVPPTSNLIQGRVGLKQDMLCLDINQGCAGYLLGLFQAFMLLDQPAIRRVVLLNADTLSRRTSPQDRNLFPMTGDAAALTVVERSAEPCVIHANVKMDGGRAAALTIPAGGYRTPSTPETARRVDGGDGNPRSLDDLHMDGTAVFNFVQAEVPPMIEALLSQAGVTRDAVDTFVFHQPNRFMLEKLADAMGVPRERVPSNIVGRFGNASSVTIPTNLCFNLAEALRAGSQRLCFAGFGVGLTWASMLMRVGPLDFCELIEG